jgi:hypothetical protein
MLEVSRREMLSLLGSDSGPETVGVGKPCLPLPQKTHGPNSTVGCITSSNGSKLPGLEPHANNALATQQCVAPSPVQRRVGQRRRYWPRTAAT